MTLPMYNDLQAWPSENVAFPVRDIDIRVSESEEINLVGLNSQIAANWNVETAANPYLFNGKLVALYHVEISDGVVRGRGQLIRYAYHLWWRRQALPPPTYHVFAMPMIISSDGAIIAIRMSQKTANAGKVYCASGSLEEDNIIDGRVDIEANMAREVAEETGIVLQDLRPGLEYYCAHFRQRVMFYRFFYASLDSSALIDRVRIHMRQDQEKEIDDVMAITAENRNQFNYAFSMPPALDLYFEKLSKL